VPGSKGASENAYTFVQRATSRPHHEATGAGWQPTPVSDTEITYAVQSRAHRPANSPSRRIVPRHLRNGRRAKSAPVGDPCVDRCARNQ
jgi:hypothetical protein